MTLKQVFIINQDLKMGKGKIAVQVAHGEVFYMSEMACGNMEKQLFGDNEVCNENMLLNYWEWVKDGLMKKVVLKAAQEEMLLLIGIMETMNQVEKWKIWFSVVYDRGLTQVPANSMTCIVTEPLDEELADHHFGHLKLL